jgi:hypothetical protein
VYADPSSGFALDRPTIKELSMRRSPLPLFAAALSLTTLSASSPSDGMVRLGHFKLLEPASWLVEDDRGDPQKAGPCGGSNDDWGTPSYIVNEAVGGSLLHLKVQETIYHPGHYRVALAVNSPTELPPDPVATEREGERGPVSVSAEVQDPPQLPVLADGLWAHHERPAEGEELIFEADIRLPNINCEACTLQIIQFMEEHRYNNPGGYSYHHCATLKITADPSKPIDEGWPAERR